MPKLFRLVLPLALVVMLALPAVATAGHTQDPRTPNVVPLGHNVQPGGFLNTPNNPWSDLAFWGNYAYQGSYLGFRILDISNPNNPREVSEVACNGTQGDLTVWQNIVVRSVDTPQQLPGNDLNRACEGTATTIGFEGLQIFDASNRAAPRFVKAVPTDCGSHTHTQYLDRANNRLIIYVSRGGSAAAAGNTPYGTTCTAQLPRITAVEIPLANPAAARVVNNNIPAGVNGCHDVAVYEELRRLYGACRPTTILWDISDPVNPRILREMTITYAGPPALTGWHSASFSWNGRILISGWEPGGGSAPECEATDDPQKKSIFFWDADTGSLLGTWVLTRPQTSAENCTIHNYNVVPYLDRHVLVQGSYQSGTSVIEFTNPASARELAWVDPAPLVPTQLGGEWSSYWYNDLIYESDITEGLNLYDIREAWWDRGINLPRLNPQTQEQTLDCTVRATGAVRAKQRGQLAVSVRVLGQPAQAIRVTLRGAGVNRAAITRANGMAQFALRPQRRGVLRVNVPDALNMQGCSTTRNIAAARKRTAPGGGGGGPGLTGRGA